MQQNHYLSTVEVGKIIGLNRTQVFRLIKKGVIPATKVGRNYIICRDDLGILDGRISKKESAQISRVVARVFKDYGEVIKQLGAE